MSPSLTPLFEEFAPVSAEAWKQKIQDDIGSRNPDDFLEWESQEDVSVPAFLQRDDLASLKHVDLDSAVPPLAHTDAEPANNWWVRQNISHPDPEEASRQAKTAVQRGATDIGLIAHGRPSRDTGLPLQTEDALKHVVQGLPVDDVRIHFERGGAAPLLLEVMRKKIPASALTGTIGYDPTGALAQGDLLEASLAYDLAQELVDSTPETLRSVSVDARVYHEAGATAVEELALGLAALSENLHQLTDRGVSLDTILPRLHVSVSVSTRYFIEVAKLRALRLLVPQVISAYASERDNDVEFGPSQLLVQAETSRRSETVYDPHVNMLRTSTEAMGAIVGGCDVLSVRPYDASLRPADNFSTRIARNTQLILQEESHFDAVVDPAAGSYYVEALTDRLAQAAWRQFKEFEVDGGLLEALRAGTVQSDLAASREERVHAAEARNDVFVGTNHYPDLTETRLGELQLEKSPSRTNDPPPEMGQPLLASIRKHLQRGYSPDTICAGFLRGSSDIESLPSLRVTRTIEEIRLRTERYARDQEGAPTVLLVPLGPAGPRSARATFARNFLGVAGLHVEEPLRFETVREAAQEARQIDAEVVVLCSADEEYPTLTRSLQRHLDEEGHSPFVIVAGSPDVVEEAAPVDLFIHQESPLRKTLEQVQRRLGIGG